MTVSGDSRGLAIKIVDVTPVLLGRTGAASCACAGLGDRGCPVLVQQSRLGCRATPGTEILDSHHADLFALRKGQDITRFDLCACFGDTLAIEPDGAAVHDFGRHRAGLKEPSVPEPLVDTPCRVCLLYTSDAADD